MTREERLELNSIAECFTDYKNVTRWMVEMTRLYVWTEDEQGVRVYTTQRVDGKWGHITEIR